jgi:hypothetical protein
MISRTGVRVAKTCPAKSSRPKRFERGVSAVQQKTRAGAGAGK